METNYNLPEAEYFTVKAASNSTLGRMKRSPAHCKEAMDNPPEQTKNMRLGSIVHKLVLEPGDFNNAYYVSTEHDPVMPRKQVVQDILASMQAAEFHDLFMEDTGDSVSKPRGAAGEIADTLLAGDHNEVVKLYATSPTDINMRTKEGKAKYAEFQAKCERESLTICKQEDLDKACAYVDFMLQLGDRQLVKHDDIVVAKNYYDFLNFIGDKEVITPEEYETASEMAASVMEHPAASKLLASGKPEVSTFWNDPDTNYPCKCRIDFISDLGYLVDLKTTGDASLSEFSRSIAKFGYHRQNAMYMDGYAAANKSPSKGFIFVAVESKPPYAVGVYNLDQQGVEKGREEYKALLQQFAECMKTNNWPAYSQQVETIDLPRWYS